jgi:hypothetical protein
MLFPMNITPQPILAQDALRIAGLPITSAHLRRLLAAGRITGQRIGSRWYTTPEHIRAALVRDVGPGATP